MSDDSTASGLLEWMNTFPEVKELGVTSFLDVRDGVAIATLWNCISPKKVDVAALGKPSGGTDWVVIRKNLGTIDTVITPVLTEKKLRGSERIDLTAIARKGQVEDLIRFVQPLVMVSLNCPIKRDVVARIKGLSPNGRKVIKTILEAHKKAEAKPAKARTTARTEGRGKARTTARTEGRGKAGASTRAEGRGKAGTTARTES